MEANTLTTQLIMATSTTEDKGLVNGKKYMFSLQASPDGIIRIITTDEIEVYYPSIHDFLISWSYVCSLGWANDKETFAKMLEELKSNLS